MIHIIDHQILEVVERSPIQQGASQSASDFAELFGSAATQAAKGTRVSAVPADTSSNPVLKLPGTPTQPTLGDPDVQQWLESYCERGGATNVTISPSSYQAAPGAGNGYQNCSYGPDAIYNQALCNVVGNAYAASTGDNAALFTSQLPGIPSKQAQADYDAELASKNLQRLESGQPIDTSAYWSDPGPLSAGGVTYTSAQLGYAGPGQSSGPEPIYLSSTSQIQGTDSFELPGYTGTVTGLQPGRYYTLQELEAAGLPKGQEGNQLNPGSWSLTPSS